MKPPKLPLHFFRWFCHPKLRDHIEGDLMELYNERVKEKGKRKADLKFIGDVLLLLRPGIIRPTERYKNLNNYGMINSYFKIGWRNIVRNKTFSTINISGLSLGITCSLLILFWVMDEKAVDTFNSNKNIYCAYERVFSDGKVDAGPWAPGQLATELKRQIPEIKYATGFLNSNEEKLFTVGEKRISMKGCAADSDFFKIFNYHVLLGSPGTALNDPDAIAISRKMAIALFGNIEAAFGNSIRMDNRKDFKITAVFEDVPVNASQQFDFVNNWSDLLQTVGWLKSWIYRSPFTFIQLHEGSDPNLTETKIKDFITPFLTANDGEGFRIELGLQPYHDMYLYSNFVNGQPQGGRIEYVRLFSVIAVFIILIACINFMNLATARSVKRAKEVGVRKTVGAKRYSLVAQFMGEALMLTFFAIVLSLIIIPIVLPFFNSLTNKHISLPLQSFPFWMGMVGLLCATGIVAGSYPAFFLSSLNPLKVLKGSLRVNPKALMFRKGLVVFQFALSIAMITGTIIISKQIDYLQSKNLGFNKDNLIYIPLQGNLADKYEVFNQQLLNKPGIQDVTRSTNAPTHINTHEYDLAWEGKDPNERVVAIHNGVGYGFLKMMGIPVLQGRDFSRNFISDSSAFIINETALSMTGYKDPIGKPLTFLHRKGTIIGVVKDFHLKSLHEPIKPLVLFLGENATWGHILVKTNTGTTSQAIASIEETFKQMEPEFQLRYYFVDEEYQKLYNSELTINKLSNGFSMFAIFISCLGLLGLTIFTVEQRMKEISIRKVIGASAFNIVNLLSKDIMKLVAISSFIAVPLAWVAMDKWLENYAYRIIPSWWLFILAAVAALFLALLTISYHAIKAATVNPVKNLKLE